MNPEQLPGWLRLPVRWFLNRLLRKGRVSAPCPRCLNPLAPPLPLPDTLWDTLVECPHCGHGMSVMALGLEARKTPEERMAEGSVPAEQPPTSRIAAEDTGAERVWRIPAKGGCSFMLVFATVWLAFTSVFVAAVVFGKWEDGSEGARLGVGAFISIFVFAGLGMLYAGLMMTRARHMLRLDAVEFVHERHFLGTVKRKAWPRESVQSVDLVVFYSENYKPVHGIEVRGERGKIRFGSALDPQEKAWLCQDLRVALGLAHAPTAEDLQRRAEILRNPLVQVAAPAMAKRITIEPMADGCLITVPPAKSAWVLFGVGMVFTLIAGFMLFRGMDMLWDGPGSGTLFDGIWSAFGLLWCAGPALFTLIGLGLAWTGWHLARTHRRIAANPHGLVIETRTGSQAHEETWSAAAVRDVRVEVASTSSQGGQDTIKHRVEILLTDRARGFGTGHPRTELEDAAAALRAALGRAQPAS